jgi:hypothetical protein
VSLKSVTNIVVTAVNARWKWWLIFLALIFLVTFIGVLQPMSKAQAQAIVDMYQGEQPSNWNTSYLARVSFIFTNNVFITVLMYIPLIGIGIGLYLMYNSGIALAAASIVQGIPPVGGFATLLIIPVAWAEFLAYAMAMSESVSTIYFPKTADDVKRIIFRGLLCFAVLFIAAAIEAALV